MRVAQFAVLVAVTLAGSFDAPAAASDGNRLVYLDRSDPYYVSRDFPRLTTPQWVGEDGVEAVVILAIDDMRGHERWEAFLRPILDRLKQIDGRAPVSIMTCDIDPADPHLQHWLREGLSLEVHTVDHPCPLLTDGDFAKAKSTYDRCVDLLASVPGNRPVAFRMPCCDSLNTVSPRFYEEIFNRKSPGGNFLQADSSVFVILTSNDPELPRELVIDADGRERFRKYLPFPSFVNTIEDYPYPFVIGGLCWEFPCIVPSDWEAQNLQKPNNPRTVDDLKAALDAVVKKQGVFDLVFHPHGWIRAEQINELIDHATSRYGGKVKFLTFREAVERMTRNVLGGNPLRATDGGDNGVRLLDLNNDGYLDVVIGNDHVRETRVWSPENRTWKRSEFPVALVSIDDHGQRQSTGARFGVLDDGGRPSVLLRNESHAGAWQFDKDRWRQDASLLKGLELDGQDVFTSRDGRDQGVRLIDLDADGRCELIAANNANQAVFRWDARQRRWARLPWELPEGAVLVDREGLDRGMRLVDLDDDRRPDLVFSNEQRYGVYLFDSIDTGWSIQAAAARRDEAGAVPMIVRGATNNGAWFHSRHLWVQNENTARLPDLVDRRSFNQLLAETPPAPKSPETSLTAMKARDGFAVELVAAEPLVVDPVNFDWGADGKLWVVEMSDYPRGIDGGKPGGRVRHLEDIDGDGRYDRSVIFLDGLSYPTSVTPWRRGALVMCAPEIFYAEDTDGDGKADHREILYTGLARANPQHRANGFVRGLDNWIYCAGAHNMGTITSQKTGDEIRTRGSDFRIRPATGEIVLVLGSSQFIRSRDDWGNWFGNNNNNPMFHFVLENHYLKRNPHVPVTDAVEDVPTSAGTALVYPRSRTIERFNDLHTANRFTSACSSIVYRDELFGASFAGNVFVSEPVHNLVHREIMTPRGVTFSSRRAVDEQHSEFLASTDNWFRPTRIRTGPDGALWVADMYRFVIEHPEWIPPEAQKRIDVRAGSHQGRIYRVYPVGRSPRSIPRLDELDTSRLVEMLESPNGWIRDKAQELIVEGNEISAVPQLERMAVSGRRATARLHALYSLSGLGALRSELVTKALGDAHAGVRRHALRLAEPLLNETPQLAARLPQLVDDPDPQVQLQLAYTLGQWDDPAAGRALGQLALKAASDRFLSAAVMSSMIGRLDAAVDVVLADVEKADDESSTPAARLMTDLLTTALATGRTDAAARLLRSISSSRNDTFAPWQLRAAARWIARLEQQGRGISSLRDDAPAPLRAAFDELAALFSYARSTAADTDAPQSARVLAVGLLGRDASRRESDITQLRGLLGPQNPGALQKAAVESLGRLDDQRVVRTLFDGWRSYSPGVRNQILSIAFRRRASISALLDALERGVVLEHEIDATRRQRLLSHSLEEIRSKAEELLAGAVESDRQKVLRQYQSVSGLTGDSSRGQKVFEKQCSICHQMRDQGHAIGPDLAALTDKSNEAMLIAILDPNRAIEARYLSYTAVSDAGLTFQGLLAEETATSVTLVEQEDKKHVIARANIDELASSGKSLMPEGLEKDIPPQDMADCLAYLRESAPLPKQIDGNRPALVRFDALRGELFCLPTNAEIYGQTLRIEEVNGSLGWWNSEDDHVVWTVEVPQESRYTVIFEWACDDSCAGNSYVVEIGGNRLTGTVEGTGDWNNFRRAVVGTVDLKPGRYRLGIRSSGRITEALFDLKTVVLAPRGAYK